MAEGHRQRRREASLTALAAPCGTLDEWGQGRRAAGQAEIKGILADHTRQLIRVREDINSLRGDDLRRETLQAQMDTRLQRIETRLNLTDA
jgi:hypothetical protein